MPRIDLAPSGDLVQGLVHGPAIDQAGVAKGFDAESHFGGEVAEIANNAAAMRKQAADSNFAFNQTIADQTAIEQQSSKLQSTLPKGAQGYAAQMQDFIQTRIDQNTSNAPSQEAADLYTKSISRYAADRLISAQQYEKTETAQKYRDDITNGNTAIASRYMSNPNYLTFNDTVKTVTDQIKANSGITHNASEEPDLIQKAAQQQAVGILEGLNNQGRYKEAQNLLKPGNPVGDSLSEALKAHYLDSASAQNNNQQSVTKTFLEGKLKDITTDILNGNHFTSDQGQALISAYNSNTKATPADKKAFQDQVMTTMAVGNSIQTAKSLPKDQRQAEMDKIQGLIGQGDNSNLRQDIVNKGIAAINHLEAQEIKDPAMAATASNPQIMDMEKQARGGDPQKTKTYLDALTKQQVFLQIPQKVLSVPQMSIESAKINTGMSPAAIGQEITKLSDTYGKYFPMAMEELAKGPEKGQPGVNPQYAIAAYLPSNDSKTNAITNIQNYKSIKEQWLSNGRVNKDYENLGLQASQATSQIRGIINAGSTLSKNEPLSKSITAQVEIEAMKAMNSPQGAKDSKDAIAQAYDKVVGANFNIMTGGRSSVLMPKNIPGMSGNEGIVNKSLDYYSTPDGLKSLGIKPIGSSDGFYDHLSQTSRWINTPGNQGARLVQYLPTGQVVPVLAPQTQYLPDGSTNETLQPIKKDFIDMVRSPPSIESKKTIVVNRDG